MLPFRNKQPKKYQCFVCGVEHTDYDEFRTHIVENHEEGREYVTCPLCEAPIRDVRLHVKVRHPGKECPKIGQMKATIWYDFSGNRQKKKSRVNFEEGYITSFKNDGQQMHYRSGYELEVYNILEEINDVIRYEVEPKDCVTKYYWNASWRKYWPDLKVTFADNHVEVWEIKPGNQTDYEQNKAKWDAAAEYLGKRGWVFKVKTEKGINKLRKLLVEQKKHRL